MRNMHPQITATFTKNMISVGANKVVENLEAQIALDRALALSKKVYVAPTSDSILPSCKKTAINESKAENKDEDFAK